MKIKQCKYFAFFLILLTTVSAYALAPVESLILGNFSEKYLESENDPLYYLFKHDEDLKATDIKNLHRSLAIYRGFYEEGKNLEKFCKNSTKIEYVNPLEKIQVERSITATLQYITLDLISRAIPQYAKYFEFTKEEYGNLVDGLVGNYCSSNLSVISKKELKNNLLLKFDKENSFVLPTVSNNKLFPEPLKGIIPERLAKENEFKYTIKIFQNTCSWSGDPQNAGLLIPFLKDSNIMAFIFRQMSGKSLDWMEASNLVTLKNDKNTLPVLCEGLICRKASKEYFENKIFHSVGGNSIYEDFRRLYCEDLKMLSYKPKEYDPRLAKIMNSITLDEEIFLNSQLSALITGVPDFLLGVDKFSKGADVLRSTTDQMMDEWANKSVSLFSKELYFEEPLTLELVDRKFYFNTYTPELKMEFDINLGEFDRINQSIGKVKMSFEINVLNSYLRYYRQAIIDLNSKALVEKERLISQFKLQITNDVQNAKDKLIIPPWKGDLEAIIVNELTDQLLLKDPQMLKLAEPGFHKINIEINYAPFALKYINHQFIMLENDTRNKLLK